MAVVTTKSTLITALDDTSGLLGADKFGGKPQICEQAITTNADDSATSTYDLLVLPMDARITDGFLQCSGTFTSAGTATVDLGVKAYDGVGLTADPDIIIDGMDIETASAFTRFFAQGTGVATLDNVSTKEIWELLGASTNPGGWAVIYATLNTTLTAAGILRAQASFIQKGA